MERVIERTEQNTISVRSKNNKYYEARISLKIGGGKSERLQKCAKAQDLAVLHLLEEIENFIDSIINSVELTFKINDNLPTLLTRSINNLQITNPKVVEKTLLIVNKINNFNAKIDNSIIINNNIIPLSTTQDNFSSRANTYLVNNYCEKVLESTTQNYKNDIFEDFAYEWIAYKFSLCKKTPNNPVPKSRKTMERIPQNYDINYTSVF